MSEIIQPTPGDALAASPPAQVAGEVASTAKSPAGPAQRPALARFFWPLFLLIALLAFAIRSWDSASWRSTGPDELLYRRYVNLMDGGQQNYFVLQKAGPLRSYQEVMKEPQGPPPMEGRGIGAFPEIADLYLRTQAQPGTQCELPPSRFTYLYAAWLWKELRFGDIPPQSMAALGADSQIKARPESYAKDADHTDPPLRALHDVTFFFSLLLVILSGVVAWRMAGEAAALGVMLLVACDPLLIHLSQHAMIDGFFAFWALLCVWTTWENLRQPNHRWWLLAHAAAIAGMVLTKENAFFVYCALGVAVVANRWLRFGTVTPKFIGASVGGGALGVALLVAIFGGVGNLMGVYKTFTTQAQTLEYVKLVGDGPWHRYLMDMLAVSPFVVCLALGALFVLSGKRKELGFLFVFVAASYLVMCNLPYGINLRFASIWDFPLRLAAVLMIFELVRRIPKYSALAGAVLVLVVGACEFRQYTILATSTDPKLVLYEMDTKSLLRPQMMIKDREDVAPEKMKAAGK
jgi:hypothetical protein